MTRSPEAGSKDGMAELREKVEALKSRQFVNSTEERYGFNRCREAVLALLASAGASDGKALAEKVAAIQKKHDKIQGKIDRRRIGIGLPKDGDVELLAEAAELRNGLQFIKKYKLLATMTAEKPEAGLYELREKVESANQIMLRERIRIGKANPGLWNNGEAWKVIDILESALALLPKKAAEGREK